MRTCTGDGSSPVGQWNGNDPVCTGIHMHVNTRNISMLSVLIFSI